MLKSKDLNSKATGGGGNTVRKGPRAKKDRSDQEYAQNREYLL